MITLISRIGHGRTVPVERAEGDTENGGLHWRTRIEMVTDDEGRPSMRRRGTHVRVPIDTMPLATRAVLEVAEMNGVWDGNLPENAQIRIAVPEPRTQGNHHGGRQTVRIHGGCRRILADAPRGADGASAVCDRSDS